MRGIMAKARCEEIVIDQYLKGNISNEFKECMLLGLAVPEDEKPFAMNFNELLKALENYPKNFLETMEQELMPLLDSIRLGICTEEEIISMLSDKLEELENELSK